MHTMQRPAGRYEHFVPYYHNLSGQGKEGPELLTKAAGITARTNHLDHHFSTVFLTAACLGSSQRSLAFLPHLLVHLVTLPASSSSPSSSEPSSLPPPKTTSPNREALNVPKIPFPLYPLLLLLPPLVSGTARNRPSNGELSVLGRPRDSVPC